MTDRPHLLARVARTALPVVLVGGLGLAAVACGGGGSSDESSGPSSSTSTTEKASTTTTAARKPCTPANLEAATAAQYPGATVQDVTCSAAFAVATISGSGVPGGTAVAYFGTQPDGTWVVLNVGKLSGDPAADTPAGMPAALPVGWKSKYDARVRQGNEPAQANVADGDYLPYDEPPPTEPPPTEPPPTEPPPEEQPPPEEPPPSE